MAHIICISNQKGGVGKTTTAINLSAALAVSEKRTHTNVIIFEISRPKFLNYIKNDCENGILILLKLAKIMSARLREADNKLKAFVNLSQWI